MFELFILNRTWSYGDSNPDLLHAIHARRVAQRRLLSPGKGLTCDDIRQASPHRVRNRCTLAPILAPADGQEPRRQPDR